MEGRISVRIQLGKTDARGGESMAVGEETCEMQLLLEILPEAERERRRNTLAAPFLPPTWLVSLPPAGQSGTQLMWQLAGVGKAEEGQGMELRADRPRRSTRQRGLYFISVSLIPLLESGDNGSIYAQTS